MNCVLANVITADMGLIPGLAVISPGFGLPLSLLAAILERPFYTRAGVRQHTIWYSMQANFISLCAGVVGLIAAACLADAFGGGARDEIFFLAWPLTAVCLSTRIEGNHIAPASRRGATFWLWTLLGNLFSAGVCVGLLFAILRLDDVFPYWKHTLAPYAGIASIITGIGSAIAFVVSFRMTRGNKSASE